VNDPNRPRKDYTSKQGYCASYSRHWRHHSRAN